MFDRLGDLPFDKDMQPVHHPHVEVSLPDERLGTERIGFPVSDDQRRSEKNCEGGEYRLIIVAASGISGSHGLERL